MFYLMIFCFIGAAQGVAWFSPMKVPQHRELYADEATI
jgi:hypothetical protein